jgi:hypothetical protein
LLNLTAYKFPVGPQPQTCPSLPATGFPSEVSWGELRRRLARLRPAEEDWGGTFFGHLVSKPHLLACSSLIKQELGPRSRSSFLSFTPRPWPPRSLLKFADWLPQIPEVPQQVVNSLGCSLRPGRQGGKFKRAPPFLRCKPRTANLFL